MSARPVPAYGALLERGALLGGRCRLQGPIGSGGTADVFRGLDQVLGREVAVKVFRVGTDTITADRFCDEARTLARLSHRALVTVYDAGCHGQGAFMVTELIGGTTLRTRVHAGPLHPVQVIRIGADISSALDHVHAHGIIHHDVKPSNVLLSEEGSPHLADFGLSRTVHDHSHSAPDTLVGTLAYMAPEQFLGQGAGTASDIYALGVTLLEALTGHREYQGTPMEIGTAHLLHPPRIPDDLPDGLARLLKTMTDQNPQARPDAAAVHLSLQDVAQAPASRPARVAAKDPFTHRSALPAVAAAGLRAVSVRAPGPTDTRVTGGVTGGRRRAALWGLAAVSVALPCVLVIGGIPAEQRAPATAPASEQPSTAKDAEAAVPRSSTPAPQLPPLSPSATPHLPAVAPSTALEGQKSTPAYLHSGQAGDDRPAKASGAAKMKDGPGKAKGKNKGR
ncbi:protein kinase [Streptomyces sp. NPDC088097]|uniref:serine/threonine-protein kinase n=1 Tax=Streptomyces sp. NPDC088097 TaxID=3365823 RepID=UPI0037F3CF9A